MKTLLRILAVVIAVIGLWAFAMLGGAFFALPAKLGTFVVWLISGAFAALCVRCGMSLWNERPFWQERNRFADVMSTVAAFLAIPVLMQIEKINEGPARAGLEIGTVGLVVGVYFVARRCAPVRRFLWR